MIKSYKNFLIKNWSFIALVFIFLFFSFNNIVWLYENTSLPSWDMASHSLTSLRYFEVIKNFNWNDFKSLFSQPTLYPPFTYIITSFFWIIRYSLNTPAFSNVFFYIILLFSVYGIGNKLINKKAGVLSALLVSLYPFLSHFSRIYGLDFALTSMVCLGIYVLLLTENFRHRKYSILFGLICGLGMLIKWSYFIFLLGPLMLIIWQIFFHFKKDQRLKAVVNILIILFLIFIIAFPWYVLHYRNIIRGAKLTRLNIFSVPYENLFSLPSLTFYARNFFYSHQSIYPFFSILFLLGLIYLLIWKRKNFSTKILFLWIFISYFIFTMVHSKETRYLLPIYPAFALISSSLINLNKNKLFKILLTLLIIFVGLSYYIKISWDVDFLFGKFIKPKFYFGYGFTHPTQEPRSTSEIIEFIAKDRDEVLGKSFNSKIALVPNSEHLNPFKLSYYATFKRLNLDFHSLSRYVRTSSFYETLFQADYIITKTGDQGPPLWTRFSEKITALEEDSNEPLFHEKFKKIKEVPLEDGSMVKIYLREDFFKK